MRNVAMVLSLLSEALSQVRRRDEGIVDGHACAEDEDNCRTPCRLDCESHFNVCSFDAVGSHNPYGCTCELHGQFEGLGIMWRWTTCGCTP
jgi:hypothetical protein